jgi:hypothetical protein
MVPVDDPERAAKFYRDVFAWRVQMDETPQGRGKVWHVLTASGEERGIDGSLSRREFPGQPIGIGIQVPSVDDFTDRVERQGGKVLVRKGAIPGVAWFSVCQDSEGNTFVLSQPDGSA